MKTNNRFLVKAEGNSMYPLLQSGDIVEYIQTPFHTIHLNDIVLVYANDILVTHRVIYKTKKTCITRGDNNLSADTVIQKGRVLAKVVRFRRMGVWYDIQEVYLTQSALYLHEIQKLETLLRLQKISHVFLKGVLISLRYEGSIPKRIYADCDVLVHRNDYKKIEKVFMMLGYKLQGKNFLRSARCFDFAQHDKRDVEICSKPEVSYMKIVSGVPVVFDVHFEPVFLMTQLGGMNFLYSSQLLTQLGEQIINSSEIKKIKGFNYSLCSVSDQILYLALHIFHHNYTDSIRYQLLDAVIRKGATKKMWDDVQNMIIEYRLEGYLYLVFILLKKYFKTSIPQSFITTIKLSPFKRKVSSYFLKRIDIFSQDGRVKAGIERFILIFLLSPEPIAKKLLLFFHPNTIQSLSWIIWMKIQVFFKKVPKE